MAALQRAVLATLGSDAAAAALAPGHPLAPLLAATRRSFMAPFAPSALDLAAVVHRAHGSGSGASALPLPLQRPLSVPALAAGAAAQVRQGRATQGAGAL